MNMKKRLEGKVITLYGEGENTVNMKKKIHMFYKIKLLKKEMIHRACNNLFFGIDKDHIIINRNGRQLTRDEFIEQLREELEEYI